jgi:photosystem II stability/assembly factor-like uncharacterized protein
LRSSCAGCGAELEPGAGFCEVCGRPVATAVDDPAGRATLVQPPPGFDDVLPERSRVARTTSPGYNAPASGAWLVVVGGLVALASSFVEWGYQRDSPVFTWMGTALWRWAFEILVHPDVWALRVMPWVVLAVVLCVIAAVLAIIRAEGGGVSPKLLVWLGAIALAIIGPLTLVLPYAVEHQWRYSYYPGLGFAAGLAGAVCVTAGAVSMVSAERSGGGAARKTGALVPVVVVVLILAVIAGIAVFATRDRGENGFVPSETGQYDQPPDDESGGSTGDGWVTQWSATDFSLHDVSFADALHGWAVGGNGDGTVGIILATTDGGMTWTVQHAGGGFAMLSAVYAIDARTCCAVGGDRLTNAGPGLILMTHDGGSSWRAQPSDHFLSDVAFADASHGWCVGEYVSGDGQCSGVVLSTDDGGQTWTSHEHDGAGWMRGVSFIDATAGWVTTETFRGEPDPSMVRVYKTTDGGATLKKLYEIDGAFSGICFIDDMHGWVAGAEAHGVGEPATPGVWATDDGGDTWTFHESGDAGYFNAIFFVDALNGWAVGDGVWCTTDGGLTWTQQLTLSGTDVYLNGCAFTDASTGFVVGGAGSVLSTSDGGVGDGTPQTYDPTAGPGPEATADEMLAYLQRIEQLIKEARRGHQRLDDSITGYRDGWMSGGEAARGLQAVIDNRTSVLNQVEGIAVPDDPRARKCSAALIDSMEASLAADACYLAWAEGSGSIGDATPYDISAGKAKKRFVSAYNPLAAQYGLRSDWEPQNL